MTVLLCSFEHFRPAGKDGDGVSMKAIQDWLGHSTFNVTANYYSHLDYKSRISSAEVISNALGDEEDENEGEKKNAGSN